MTTNGTKISFQPIGSTSVRILGETEDIIPYYFNEELISLELPGGKIISLGETFTIRNISYKINIIKSFKIENELYYDLKIAEKTKSSLFILPMLGGTRSVLFYDSLLINTFIQTPEDKDCIVLLYRKAKTKAFKKFIIILQGVPHFKRLYEPTDNYIVFVLNVPKRHKKNFKYFKEGKYSKFSDVYKLQILDFHRMDIDGSMGQILFKSRERREKLEKNLDAILPKDSELYSIMTEKDETFNLNYYL